MANPKGINQYSAVTGRGQAAAAQAFQRIQGQRKTAAGLAAFTTSRTVKAVADKLTPTKGGVYGQVWNREGTRKVRVFVPTK